MFKIKNIDLKKLLIPVLYLLIMKITKSL